MIGSGEIAALFTALSWALTAFFFGRAGRLVGSRHVNLIRLVIAVCFLALTMPLFNVSWGIPPEQATLLALSGFIGLVIGDATYFEALVVLGPRRGSLLMTLAPPFTAVLQWPLLDEGLGVVALVGMFVTLGGVAWVVLERARVGEIEGSLARGITLGIIGALMQALGIIVAKAGLGKAEPDSFLASLFDLPPRVTESIDLSGVEIDPLYGTLIRMAAGMSILFVWFALRGRLRSTLAACKHRKALTLTTIGAFVGPFIGVWLSLYAAANTNTAVAMTIIGVQPVLVIPIVMIVLKEKVSLRAFLGAIVAIAGVALLAFRTSIEQQIGLVA